MKLTSPTCDPFKHFAAWLAALFLVVLGAKLWVVQLFGSPLPFWDQWFEARDFLIPWMEGHRTWKVLFSANNEHRIFFTHLLDLTEIYVNERWEPMLQMTVNAFIHAGYVCGLAFCLWDFLGRKNGWLICFLLMPYFALPYAGENTVWAINSQQYLMSIFSLAALAGLGFGKPSNVRWWFGLAAAIMASFTMASGFLAAMAVGGLAMLRTIKIRRIERGNLITLTACLVVIGLGVTQRVELVNNSNVRAHTLLEFASALIRNLTWPFFSAPEIAWLILLPLVMLAVLYFRSDFQESRAAEFLMVFGLWGALQSAAIAFGRANYGEGIPASRYMDVLNVLVIANLFAMVLLARFWMRGEISRKFALLLPLFFAAVIFFGLCRNSQMVVEGLLIPTRMMNLIAEERVETFMATGDERELLERPTVHPDPKLTLEVLRNAKLQSILPAVCLPPKSAQVTGRFTRTSQWLLRHHFTILYCGLALFAGLIGYGLTRDPLGLAWENIPAFIALLTLLGTLGFVWSKTPITRETIERELQYKLTAIFNSANNPRRAAIHEHKAEALKNQ